MTAAAWETETEHGEVREACTSCPALQPCSSSCAVISEGHQVVNRTPHSAGAGAGASLLALPTSRGNGVHRARREARRERGAGPGLDRLAAPGPVLARCAGPAPVTRQESRGRICPPESRRPALQKPRCPGFCRGGPWRWRRARGLTNLPCRGCCRAWGQQRVSLLALNMLSVASGISPSYFLDGSPTAMRALLRRPYSFPSCSELLET